MMINEPKTQSLIRRIKRIKRKYGINDSQIQAKIAEHQAEVKALPKLGTKREKLRPKRSTENSVKTLEKFIGKS